MNGNVVACRRCCWELVLFLSVYLIALSGEVIWGAGNRFE
jgi:hypothetical protein